MTVTGSKSALGLALVVALGAAPGPVRMTGEEAAAPEMPSFLLPAPLSGGQSDRMRQLFSAPVLNGGLLESMADENELASRRALIERQHALAVSLCALEAGAREQELMRLRRLQQRQLLRWMGVQERYEHMLAFRLHEAIGQPLPTGDLPLAYAWSDIENHSGWKAQLEAAERLARARALPASILDQLYTAQRPAASGGVWERAAAVQALDAALATGDAARIGPALVTAFQRMEQAGLRDSFAAIAAPRLQPEILQGDAAHLALWLRLWAGETEVARAPEDKLDASLLALATGGQPEPLTPALGALAPVFAAELPPQPDPKDGIALAPALYGALADADAGTQGDITRAVRGVRMLRELGLIADARRVATQIAIDPLLKVASQ